MKELYEERFHGKPYVIVHAPVCRPGWLIEMECMAIKKISNPEYAKPMRQLVNKLSGVIGYVLWLHLPMIFWNRYMVRPLIKDFLLFKSFMAGICVLTGGKMNQ